MQIKLAKKIDNARDFMNWINQFKNRKCFILNNANYTYEHFINDINNTITYFKNNHYKTGSYIGLLINGNTYEYIVSLFAIWLIGCIAVPIDEHYCNEIDNFFNNFKFSLILYDQNNISLFNKWQNKIKTKDKIDISQISFSKHINIKKNNYSMKIHGDLPGLVVFSSGTTGSFKITLLAQKTIFLFVDPNHLICKHQNVWKKSKKFMAFLPLKRSMTIMWSILWPLMFGWEIHLFPETLIGNTINLIETFKNTKPQLMFIIPPLLPFLYKANHEIKFLTALACGGAWLDPIWIKKFKDDSVDLCNGLGMVEAQTPFIAMPHIAKIFPGCIGEPITKNIRFKFTNDHELLIKHNALLLGYIKNGKVKVAVDKNGYFHTNGIAHVIDKNILLWKGRLKHTKLDQQLIKSWKNYDANM